MDLKLKNDSDRLRVLYDQRVPTGMSQEKFGETYGIGSQQMVWQYLSGKRPLNFEAAAKFAKGLRCTIAEISPELARKIKTEFLPVLGRVSLVLAFITPPLVPTEAQARSFNIITSQITHWLRRLRLARHQA